MIYRYVNEQIYSEINCVAEFDVLYNKMEISVLNVTSNINSSDLFFK